MKTEDEVMANVAAKLFCDFMEAQDLNCNMVDENDGLVRVGWRLKSASISIFIKFNNDCTNVHLEGFDFLRIPEDKTDMMYRIVNECNDEYRWLKFVVDNQHEQVVTKVDALIQLDTCAQETFELVVKTAQIVDDAYPKFMKALWA